MISRPFFLSLAFLAATLLPACDNAEPGEAPLSGLLGVLEAEGTFTTLVEALSASEVDSELQSGGPYTLFAPTDLAFEFFGADTVERLLAPENADLLDRIMRYHVVAGRLSLADLQPGQTLESLDGSPLLVELVDGELKVGGTSISEADIETANGVIHGIGDVFRMNLHTADRLRIVPITAVTAGLVIMAGADARLATEDPVTLFAPIDNAWLAFGQPELDLLMDPTNVDVLSRVVGFHLADGELDVSTMEPGSTITTEDGTTLTLTADGSARFLNGRRIISEPIETANGLIFLLDGVQQDSLKIGELLRVSPRLTTYSDLVSDRPDLLALLASTDEHTIFAPLNVAFEAFSPDVREAIFLPENASLLEQLTRVHIVPGGFSSEELTDGLVLQALDGTELPVQVSGADIFVGGRLLDSTDRAVENGAFHQVALVIKPNLNIVDKLVLEGFLNQVDALRRAGLESLFDQAGPFTMFAFDSSVFEAEPELLGRDDLGEILLYHGADRAVGPLEHGIVFQSLEGSNRTIAFDAAGKAFRLDGVGAITDWGPVLNGHLYSVDALTVPPPLLGSQ